MAQMVAGGTTIAIEIQTKLQFIGNTYISAAACSVFGAFVNNGLSFRCLFPADLLHVNFKRVGRQEVTFGD